MGKKSKKNRNKNAQNAAQAKSEAPAKELEEKGSKMDSVSESKTDAKLDSPISAKGEVTPPSTATRGAKNTTPPRVSPKASTSAPTTPKKSPVPPTADSKDVTSSPAKPCTPVSSKSTPSTEGSKSTPSTAGSKAVPSSPLPVPPSSGTKSPARAPLMPPTPPSPSAAASTPIDKQVIEEAVKRRPSLRDAHDAAVSNVLLPSMHAVEHSLKPHDPPAKPVSAKLQPTIHTLETNLKTGHVKEVLKEHIKEHAEHAEAPSTAPLIANTAAAVKTKIAAHELQKKMERRPSVDALKESGILPPQAVTSPHPLSTPQHSTIGASNNVTPAQQPSSEHLLQRQHSRLTESPEPPYRPYATLSRRQVMGIGLKVISELRKRSLIDDMVSGFVKEKLFVDDLAMIQAIEKFVETQDLDPLASMIYHIQEAVAERNM